MANNLFKNMNLLNQNGAKPKNTVASIEDQPKEDQPKEDQPKEEAKPRQQQRKRMKRGKYKKLPKDFEFPTNLKISNRQRNALRVVALTGHAKNQKEAITFLLDRYRRGLRNEAKTQYDTMLKMLNESDSEYYAKHHKNK